MVDNPKTCSCPRTYYESKMKTAVLFLLLIVGLVLIRYGFRAVELEGWPYYVILIAVLGLLFWFYPATKITLYNNRFEYQKGFISWVAPWTEVEAIYVNIKADRLVLIKTPKGFTKIIDPRTLRRQSGVAGSGNSAVDERAPQSVPAIAAIADLGRSLAVEFIGCLEELSGKKAELYQIKGWEKVRRS